MVNYLILNLFGNLGGVMKLSIKTSVLQDMVAKAAKGASENKIMPLTSMMAIEVKDKRLTLTTTDTANTLILVSDGVDGDDLYAVVPVQQFSKLIAKTTVEKVTITVKEASLEVKGNGVYNIPLTIDESGIVVFPQPQFKKVGRPSKINLTTIKSILLTNRSAVAKSLDTPQLCGYFLGENVVSSNEAVICFNKMKVYKQPLLISPEMMELLSLNTEENIDFWYDGKTLWFETPSMILVGEEHAGKDAYPIEEISGFLEANFSASCKLSKPYLLDVLDRLALFIEPYDKNGAYFNFTNEGLTVTSKQSKSVEMIKYTESLNYKPFLCCVDIPMFREQLIATPGDVIELWYGHEAAVKLTGGNVEHIISLLEDEALEENSGTTN